MSRNRVLYNVESLYCSQNVQSTGVTQHAQLKRVQNFSSSADIARESVLQVGELSRIDALVVAPP